MFPRRVSLLSYIHSRWIFFYIQVQQDASFSSDICRVLYFIIDSMFLNIMNIYVYLLAQVSFSFMSINYLAGGQPDGLGTQAPSTHIVAIPSI